MEEQCLSGSKELLLSLLWQKPFSDETKICSLLISTQTQAHANPPHGQQSLTGEEGMKEGKRPVWKIPWLKQVP